MREGLKDYAPLFLRIGLAATFTLFGWHKLSSPEQSVAEIQLLLNSGLGSASAINYYLGLTELTIALSFWLGWGIKHTGLIATLLIAFIFGSLTAKYGLNFDPLLLRDVGLISAAFTFWILGAGPWSIDGRKSGPAATPPQ